MKNLKLSVVFTLYLLLSGCASILNGDQQDLSIKTHDNAEIFIDDRYVGTGYVSRSVNRDQAHEVRVELGDCRQTFTTEARFNYTALLGLIIDAGLITIPTDFVSGAAWNVYPDKIKILPTCQAPGLVAASLLANTL
jgi:hypothetical protein